MRSKVNYGPAFDYLNEESALKNNDDLLMFIDFAKIELEYKKDQIDFEEMQKSSSIDERVFSELFLDKEVEFVDVLDLDQSYPLYV